MADIRLIALDLDGTLLSGAKELSERNRAALAAAAEKGIEIVPSTGRFYSGMPEEIRALPFVRYTITINGAQVWDAPREREVYAAPLALEQSLAIMRYLDGFPIIYDCYMDNRGWMTAALHDKVPEFAPDKHYLKMLLELRTPVPELKDFVAEHGTGVQKIQLFAKDKDLLALLRREIPERFPGVVATSSVRNNIEINAAGGNKGEALLRLAAYLGLRREQTMAFGDGSNDLSMLRAAGVGVAMANAVPEVRAAADRVTGTNDEDGVAQVVEELL